MVQRVFEDMLLAPVDLHDEWSQKMMQVSDETLGFCLQA
jgi:hypothetical protein